MACQNNPVTSLIFANTWITEKTLQFHLLFKSCHHCLTAEYQRFGEECCLLLRGQSDKDEQNLEPEENEPAPGQQEGYNGNVRIAVKMGQPRQYGITTQTTSLYPHRCDSLRI